MKIKSKLKVYHVIGICGAIVGITAVCVAIDKLFKANNQIEHEVINHIFDYQEFWLKDGTNAFVHTWDGKVDSVEFNYQSGSSLPDALNELAELAKDMGFTKEIEFDHVTFSEF